MEFLKGEEKSSMDEACDQCELTYTQVRRISASAFQSLVCSPNSWASHALSTPRTVFFFRPTQRVIGFGICFVLGWIITVAVRFVLQCRPKRFFTRKDRHCFRRVDILDALGPRLPVSPSHRIESFYRQKSQSMFFLKDLKKFAIMYSIGSITAIARFVHTFSAVSLSDVNALRRRSSAAFLSRPKSHF